MYKPKNLIEILDVLGENLAEKDTEIYLLKSQTIDLREKLAGAENELKERKVKNEI